MPLLDIQQEKWPTLVFLDAVFLSWGSFRDTLLISASQSQNAAR